MKQLNKHQNYIAIKFNPFLLTVPTFALRETSVSRTANVGTVGINGLKSCVTDPHQGFARKISAIPSGNLSGRPIKVSFLLRRKWSSRNGFSSCHCSVGTVHVTEENFLLTFSNLF